MAKLFLRIDLGADRLIGPGKVRLLELIVAHGSIAAAGRAMGMSYRRAWLLVAELNRTFRTPVVETQHGGRAGGGAAVTTFGREIIRRYRAMEAEAHAAVADHLDALQAARADAPEDMAEAAAGRAADCRGGADQAADAQPGDPAPKLRCRLPFPA